MMYCVLLVSEYIAGPFCTEISAGSRLRSFGNTDQTTALAECWQWDLSSHASSLHES